MTRLQDKAQGLTKQFVGEMIGDGELVEEGRRQEQSARLEQDASKDEAAGARRDDPSAPKSSNKPSGAD